MTNTNRVIAWTVFVAMTILGAFSTYCAWRSGQVQGYCEAKYGPSVEVVWTGDLGITGECEIAPAIPATREVVP